MINVERRHKTNLVWRNRSFVATKTNLGIALKMNLQPIYVLGPTASGKSEFAYRLAKSTDSVVISADSMQIYRGLDVGTAKESVERRQEIDYKLIDFLPSDAEYSVAEFAESAKKEIEDALGNGKLPIVVGGTGLYFESLFYPLSFGKIGKNDELRKKLEKELEENGAEYIHKKLEGIDVETAKKLHVNDTKRVIRALEIALSGEKTKSEIVDTVEKPNVIVIGFNTDRAVLYEKINRRVDEMFDMGLVDEVFSVGKFDCQSMKAIGYKEFKDYLPQIIDGKFVLTQSEIDEIKEKIKKNTRNYAKRQLTWFRRYDFVQWFECGDFDGALNFVKLKLSE